jgi:hypothetical protein
MRSGIDHEETKKRIEQWRAEAHRMWASAHQLIQRVRPVQDRLIELSQSLQNNHRIAPWGGRVAELSTIHRPILPPDHFRQATEDNSTH